MSDPVFPSRNPRQRLPERPNLRHLRDQARRMLRAGEAKSLSDAQLQVARLYGFPSWPKLKSHVDSIDDSTHLKHAIDSNDVEAVKRLVLRNPSLHTAPLGYGESGALTWVAECRIPWEPPGAARLEMAQWLIDNGSDVHQGGDGPLMRAALAGYRIPMMELLVANGANVNARWNGNFPIIFAPCESLDPEALGWLLANGADPTCGAGPEGESALDYLIGSYVRSTQLAPCIDLLMNVGCPTRRGVPGVLEILRGRTGDLAALLASDRGLIHKHFPDLDFGASGTRRLTLRAGTLLHVAAEYGNIDAARLLLNRGADVNARALTDDAGLGGQTPLFHAVSHRDRGLAVVQLLSSHGADLNIRARVPGHYEREDEVLECTALTYARLFPGTETQTVRFLEAQGAQE